MTHSEDRVLKKLKPCPFCGGEAHPDGRINYSAKHEAWWPDGSQIREVFFVNCMKCSVSNQGFIGHQTKDEAIAAWNRRADPLVEELRGSSREPAQATQVSSDPTANADELRWRVAKPGRFITISQAEENVGNAVLSPEEDEPGCYWTLIGQGPEDQQNALAEIIAAALNAHPDTSRHVDGAGKPIYLPLLSGGKANHPLKNHPGKRLVGFIVDEEVAGLSDGIFMLEALVAAQGRAQLRLAAFQPILPLILSSGLRQFRRRAFQRGFDLPEFARKFSAHLYLRIAIGESRQRLAGFADDILQLLGCSHLEH